MPTLAKLQLSTPRMVVSVSTFGQSRIDAHRRIISKLVEPTRLSSVFSHWVGMRTSNNPRMFIVRKPSKAPLIRLEEHRDFHPLDPQDPHLEGIPDMAGSSSKFKRMRVPRCVHLTVLPYPNPVLPLRGHPILWQSYQSSPASYQLARAWTYRSLLSGSDGLDSNIPYLGIKLRSLAVYHDTGGCRPPPDSPTPQSTTSSS